MTEPLKKAEAPGIAVISEATLPPVQDSATERVLPFWVRILAITVASVSSPSP